MLARFGQVLCWGASVVALLCVALFAYFAFSAEPDRYSDMIAFAIIGAAVWVFGRALNYALFRR